MDDSAAAQTPVQEIESAVRDTLGGEYQIQRLPGQGGMSVVFLAEELNLGRPVALKVFPQSLAIEKSAQNRFRHEPRIAASLDHHAAGARDPASSWRPPGPACGGSRRSAERCPDQPRRRVSQAR